MEKIKKLKESEILNRYERENYALKQLIEISKALNSTLNFFVLIDSILLTCMAQMRFLSAGIFLKKSLNSDNFFLHRDYKGFELDHNNEFEIENQSLFIKTLSNSIKCYTLDELQKQLENEPGFQVLEIIKPQIIVPLFCKNEVNGILILSKRMKSKDLHQYEKDFLINLASLAGIAIHNAELYEMASTDMMTRLKVHHYFQNAIIEEMEKAANNKYTLTLIMADIDHFKEFNDTNGHSAGDAVIIKVAEILRENLREIDIAARYGGEEFAVILPKTTIEEAFTIAERIRTTVENEDVVYESIFLKVTLSVGVTSYNHQKDISKNSFINRADSALYKSKNNGRNCTTIIEG